MSGIKPPKNLFDGQYPSEELLDWIKGYDCCHKHKASRLLKVVKKVWWGATFLWFRGDDTPDGYRLTLLTGGWSGNEEIIAALQGNWTFWPRYWESSERGGRHVFRFYIKG